MNRALTLLAGATLAALCAGCAGQSAGMPGAFSPAATSGAERVLAPESKSPLAGTVVLGDYNGNAVQYVAPKTGKLLYQLSGTASKVSYPSGLAVDGRHNTYVLGHFDNAANKQVFEILVFDANAPLKKNPKPARIIRGSHTQLSVGSLDADRHGRIYVTVQNPVNAILIFAKGAKGNVAPTRVISGSLTQLGATNGIAIAHDGTIHVATYGKVLTFSSTASGNAAPVSSLTVTAGSSLNGLSIDPDGNILVADYNGAVYAYAGTASGSASPLWTLAGSRTKLLNVYSAVTDKAGYLYVSFGTATGGEVGIYHPRGGNRPPIHQLTFSFPGFQIAAMP